MLYNPHSPGPAELQPFEAAPPLPPFVSVRAAQQVDADTFCAAGKPQYFLVCEMIAVTCLCCVTSGTGIIIATNAMHVKETIVGIRMTNHVSIRTTTPLTARRGL
jgi:hypothetical protein